MKIWLRAALLSAIASVSGYAAGDGVPLSLQEYRSRLEQYKSQIQRVSQHHEYAVDFYREVPPGLQVNTAEGEITVSLGFLRDGLETYLKATPAAKTKLLSELEQRIAGMVGEAETFEGARAGDPVVRERLNQILATREFSRLRGPTELQLLGQRIREWLNRKLNQLFPKAPDLDQWGAIFVWIVIAIVTSVLALWLYRRSLERLTQPAREVVGFFPSAKGWRAWLAESHQMASLGQWRDAIHLGFWAAVARLESDGVWPPDKARTPREYLNAITPDHRIKPSFSEVTRTFEAAWYGQQNSSAVDFQRFAAQLENLGCRE
jgi:hypothetical protein